MSNASRVRTFALLTAASLLSTAACASAARSHDPASRFASLLDSLGRDTAGLEGPDISLSTDNDYGRYSRVSTRLYVNEDAYVTLVNVSPAGYARIVFPEDPADDALLPGGKVYTVPSFFTGYRHVASAPAGAAGMQYVWYGRSSNARLGARGPGYMFVIASRTPLDLAALEREGYFDENFVGTSVSALEPSSVIPHVALLATRANGRGVSVDYARYSGYDPMAYGASMFRSAYDTGYCDPGYAAFWPVSVVPWDLSYGQRGCSGSDLLRWQRRNALLMPRMPRPLWPVVPPDSTSTDSLRSVPPHGKPKVDTLPVQTTRAAAQATESARDQFLRLREQLRETVTDEDLLLGGEPRRRVVGGERGPVREDVTSEATSRRTRMRATSNPSGEHDWSSERASRERPARPQAEAHARPRAERQPEPRAEPAPRVERPAERPAARPVERPTPEPGGH